MKGYESGMKVSQAVHCFFYIYKNIFYKNIEAEMCEMLRFRRIMGSWNILRWLESQKNDYVEKKCRF